MLKKKNKIYPLQKNIDTTRSSKKLNHVKIKSFKIIKSIKRVSFKLNLSERIKKKYLVFHILLLKSASLEISVLYQVLNNYLINQKECYKVQKLFQYKEIQD